MTSTPSMIQGTVDHLRACSHTSRWCFGLRYSGVGDASKINPSPAFISPWESLPSGVVRRAVSKNPNALRSCAKAATPSSWEIMGTTDGVLVAGAAC